MIREGHPTLSANSFEKEFIMNKLQLIVAALAVGAASVAFADDMTTTTTTTPTSGNCTAKMSKEACDAVHGTMSGTDADATCTAPMTQAECDTAGGKMDNSMGVDTNNTNTDAPVTTQ